MALFDVPGLLSSIGGGNPDAMQQFLLNMGAGMLSTPGNGSLGAGLQQGLKAYSGYEDKQLDTAMNREKLGAMQDERAQQSAWNRMFGIEDPVRNTPSAAAPAREPSWFSKTFGDGTPAGGAAPVAPAGPPRSTGENILDRLKAGATPPPPQVNDPKGLLNEFFAPQGGGAPVPPNVAGLPPELARTAQLESGGRLNAQNPQSSAAGPFQFTDATARQYGLTDKTDLAASADAASRLWQDNAAALTKKLGRAPNDAELYLAHQQGAGGAGELLSAPGDMAIDALTRAYKGDRATAQKALLNNGGSLDMTAGDFAAKWTNKYNKTGAPAQMQTGRAADTTGGMKATIDALPANVRNIIGMMGPKAGMQALSTYVGKKPDTPSENFISVKDPSGAITPFRADDPRLDAALATPGAIVVTTPSSNGNDGTNYILPSGETILSYDGKTYEGDDGKPVKLPARSIKLGAESAAAAARTAKFIKTAKEDLPLDVQGPTASGATVSEVSTQPSLEDSARVGSGATANLQAAVDGIAGGLGVDKAFGQKDGFFPSTTANRQHLTNIRQVTKGALINNPRFPVAEQKNVDAMLPDPNTFWANPATEARKVPMLRNTLQQMRELNNEAIATGALPPDKMADLVSNNVEIKKALSLLGPGSSDIAPMLKGKPTPAAAAASGEAPTRHPAAIPVGAVVTQGGVRYQRQPDGSMKELK